MNHCCICDKPITMGHNSLCKEHWDEYHDRINEPWLKFLISEEHKERRYRRRTKKYLSLEQTIGNL